MSSIFTEKNMVYSLKVSHCLRLEHCTVRRGYTLYNLLNHDPFVTMHVVDIVNFTESGILWNIKVLQIT